MRQALARANEANSNLKADGEQANQSLLRANAATDHCQTQVEALQLRGAAEAEEALRASTRAAEATREAEQANRLRLEAASQTAGLLQQNAEASEALLRANESNQALNKQWLDLSAKVPGVNARFQELFQQIEQQEADLAREKAETASLRQQLAAATTMLANDHQHIQSSDASIQEFARAEQAILQENARLRDELRQLNEQHAQEGEARERASQVAIVELSATVDVLNLQLVTGEEEFREICEVLQVVADDRDQLSEKLSAAVRLICVCSVSSWPRLN